MSDVDTVLDTLDGKPPTRQPKEPPKRDTLNVDLQPPAETEHEQTGPTPEEALEEARARLAERDAENARLREEATRAARERDEAKSGTATAEARALQAHEASLNSSITAAQSASERAKEAVFAAQEAGDRAALSKAMDDHADARARLANLNIQKQQFDTWKEQQKAAPAPKREAEPERQTGGPSAEAQRWLDAHPEMGSDSRAYRVAEAGHFAALADGHPEGSREYVRAVDDFYRARFPEAKPFYGEARKPNGDARREPPASSMAPSPSRAGGPGSQTRGTKTMTAGDLAREMGVTEDEIHSFAKFAGYVDKKGNVKMDAYLADQTKLVTDRRAGRPTGLLSTGDITAVR